MKLLIITQKVDRTDPILGFFHRWIEEFAKHCEQVVVVALGVGEYDLPRNVRVFSLGKERGVSRTRYIIHFYRIIWRERKHYDSVFVHMNPEYVVLGGVFWRAWRKRVGLWYTHKSVDLKVRVAEKLAQRIFTASKESFRLPSRKVVVVGHGIDTDVFKPGNYIQGDVLKMCSVSRISQTKNQKRMIDVIELLKKRGLKVKLYIVGSAITTEDKAYEEEVKKIVEEKKISDEVIFLGDIIHTDVPNFLQTMDVCINLSNTGSLDKAVLEAMACGRIVVTSNEAFKEVFSEEDAQLLLVSPPDAQTLADCLQKIQAHPPALRSTLGKRLRQIVVESHALKTLIPRMCSRYEQL